VLTFRNGKLPAPAFAEAASRRQAQDGASGKRKHDYRVGFPPRLQGGASRRLARESTRLTRVLKASLPAAGRLGGSLDFATLQLALQVSKKTLDK